MRRILADTGPIVALLDVDEPNHAWAKEVFSQVDPPLFTCEAVVTEACFLARRLTGRADAVLDLVVQGILKLDFQLGAELVHVRKLVLKYASVPMSLADACLVRMNELDRKSVVLTLDEDFLVYRRERRHAVPVIMPG